MPRRRPREPPLRSFFGDAPIDPVRSATMSKIGARDTAPEIALRRALWRKGVRYRLHPSDVPGRPDIVHKGAKVAVFVDGCFWHGCPKHFRAPKTRTEFWQEKIRRNRRTRKRVLTELGPEWRVFEFYECELKREISTAARTIGRSIRSRRPT